jgi:HD-like signal output (HDOD) protein
MSDSARSWVQALGNQALPVSGEKLSQCRTLLDSHSAALSDIGQVINTDPGLATLIFRYVNQGRVKSGRPLISTIDSSLNLLGAESLRQLFDQATVLEELIPNPRAQHAWYQLIGRSYHAARLAQEWANRQSDRAPSEVFIATFLMDLGEYCVAAVDVQKFTHLIEQQSRQLKQVAELQTLGVLSRNIGSELASQWGLPELLQDTLNPAFIMNHRVQLCSIPSALAYEADINGWNTEAMQACYEVASDILRQSLPATTRHIHESSVSIAREMHLPGVRAAAARLVELPGEVPDDAQTVPSAKTPETQASAIRILSSKLTQAIKDGLGANNLMKLALQSLGEDFGFDRCLLFLPDAEKKRLTIRAAPGFSRTPLLKRARPRIDRPGLFASAMSKPQALRIYDDNYPRVAASIPEELGALIQSANFMLFSIVIGDKPMALIYSDMSGHPIGPEQIQEAKSVASLLTKAITHSFRQS